MTPEEKADELIYKFHEAPLWLTKSDAKDCAIILCNEILKDYELFNAKHKSYKVPLFWQSVKQIIQTT